MPRNVNAIIKQLSPAQRKKVEARAAQLIAEEMTLRELRRARKLSQERVAKELGIEKFNALQQNTSLHVVRGLEQAR